MELTDTREKDRHEVTRETVIAEYLEWRNNYLTAETFGEHRGLNLEETKLYLELHRMVANNPHPES